MTLDLIIHLFGVLSEYSVVYLMKYLTVLVFVSTILLAPVADAHGADSFQFIMRNGSIQPDDAQVTQNDRIGFNNVVMDHERTVKLDHPSNSSHNWSCTASPYNSSGTDDECWLWLDPLNWSAGEYNVLVYSNGTLWNIVNITIIFDSHNETTPNFVLPGGDINQGADKDNSESRLLLIGILLLSAAFFLTIKRKSKQG